MTTFEEFRALCARGNVIPVHETLSAGAETPTSAYRKIRSHSPYSFLLESVEGGEHLARYSFVGFNPFMKFTIEKEKFSVEALHDDVHVLPTLVDANDHPLTALKKLFEHIKTVKVDGLPRFTGGAVGYFGYESVRLVESVPEPSQDDLGIPDAVLLFFDVLLVMDNITRTLVLISNAYVRQADLAEKELRQEYEKAAGEIRALKALLAKPEDPQSLGGAGSGKRIESLSRQEYCSLVEKAKRYILDGDIFQVVLSQRIRQDATVDPFELYRNLRSVNPSPYLYFLQLDSTAVIGSSPEMLVRVEQGTVQTRPIAGTRRRGKTPGEDLRLEQELLADPKERAEHLMLVDLGRNDLGRISEFGSVQVTQLMGVERYSHVMHIVSNVSGRLRKGMSPIDALFSCFPAGTLTGAPKIRAMEIIAECEPVRRGIYGGAIAYLDFSGNLDSCIAIRTIVARNGNLYFQAGAGIVHDSVPEREYEETLEKLAANFKALEMVRP